MKQIVAVVKPFVAQQVITSLSQESIVDLLIREVKGYGRQKNYLDQYGESEYAWVFLPKVEINVWVEDHCVESVIARITQSARSDAMGDGKILILPVDRVVI
jgi:nitrogen regulatory protein PII